MALDTHGYIRLPPAIDFQAEFLPVITALAKSLVSTLGEKLHSAYLYGSVAQGHALRGVSDLDVCLVLHQPFSEQEKHLLAKIGCDMALRYPVVSKVDFDVDELPTVLATKNLFSWGYWLKHHCRCIYGEDLTTRFSRFKPSRAIAVAVNGDFIVVLEQYIEQLSQLTDKNAQQKIQRMAARKLIRSTNLLRTDADNDWPETLDEYVTRLEARYPLKAADIRYFLAESHTPADNAVSFARRLTAFINWLDKTQTEYR